MMRSCRTNPKWLAYLALKGPHNFNANPLVSLGTKTTIHETIDQSSQGLNGTKGWLIGPLAENY
eukprot:13380722-Ditylum_brightwellii.AAC.1